MPTIPTPKHKFDRDKSGKYSSFDARKDPIMIASHPFTQTDLHLQAAIINCPPCNEPYFYGSQPKPMPRKKNVIINPFLKPKLEPPPPPPKQPVHLMYDKRVVRGTNYIANQILDNLDPFDRRCDIRRIYNERKKRNPLKGRRNIIGTPPPMPGRCHEKVQTNKYLEALTEPVTDIAVDTQTDMFLNVPPAPPFVPSKVGIDVATEIKDGDLFHFEVEAQPIIDVLVDSCLEQCMLEVAHEKEMERIREKQEQFLARREIELAELRRLQAEEVRLQEEKDRRLRQEAIANELEAQMQKNITAAKLLQGHIASILPEILDHMEPVSDAMNREDMNSTICPWLSHEVAEEVGQIVDSREILTVIIQEIIKQRAAVYANYREGSAVDEESISAEEGVLEEVENESGLECISESASEICPTGFPPQESESK